MVEADERNPKIMLTVWQFVQIWIMAGKGVKGTKSWNDLLKTPKEIKMRIGRKMMIRMRVNVRRFR